MCEKPEHPGEKTQADSDTKEESVVHEHLGLDQESGEWLKPERDGEEENLSGKSEEWDDGLEESDN